ncbi:MAG: hypothetical protein JRD92_04495 [Deltaproteobacteria bacterium]|nr:hypothetical protein [Deltaproteobacteria bacterium]
MKYCFSYWTCVFALLAFPLVGCSDLDSSGAGGTGGGGSGGNGGANGAEPVELTLTLVVGATGADRPPLEDAEFCETDTENCEMTDANGQATIEVDVPEDGRISYTYTKSGYASVLRTEVVDDTFVGERTNWTLTDAEMKRVSDLLMTPYPMQGTGSLVLSVGLLGATFELVGASGKGFYYDAQGDPSLDLDSTIANGAGGFVEVAPDEVEVRLGGTATNCVAAFGWPGSEANTIRIPIKAGFVSWSSMNCEAATVALSVEVTGGLGFSWEDTFGGPPLEGVEVCETDTSNCATTDAEGETILMLPANQETSYTVEKEGWVPYLIAGVLTGGTATNSWPMLSDQLGEEVSDIMMTPYPWTGGGIALTAFPRMAGVTFDLVDATAEGFYVGGTATTCTRSFGWPADAANRIRLPVQVGYLSFGSMNNCDAP